MQPEDTPVFCAVYVRENRKCIDKFRLGRRMLTDRKIERENSIGMGVRKTY